MIFVLRTTKPSPLAKNCSKWTKELLNAIKDKDAAKKKKCQGKYAHRTVKDHLKRMFEDKCAYCESSIGVVNYGHIEHYRPKNKYPRLTFEWRNLLLSCDICNDAAHKGEKFPTKSAHGPIVDPTRDDPTDHLDFHYDPISKTAYAISLSDRGQTTLQMFDLNGPSRKDLIRVRSNHVRQLLALKQYEIDDPEAAAILEQARKSSSPYAAWIAALGI